jgi:NitT/TauT family transport system substrate-binding protein
LATLPITRYFSLAIFLGVALTAIASGWMSAALAADRVRLALPAKSMGYLPLFVAVHRGFFRDENIDIEIAMMLPQLAHNALLSGEVDYHGVADSALRLAARGAPLKAIFFGATRPNYFLMAKPQIKSVGDLRGKYIGMVRYGDTVELASRIALSREGIDLQKDAIPILIGLPTTRVAALAAGSIDATIAVPPDNVLLKQKGFRELLFLGDAVEFPSNGYATSDRQLNDKRELTRRLLRALYRGLTFARERADESIQIIEREWKVDSSVAREAYVSLAKSFSRDGAASESGLRFHTQQIQKSEKGSTLSLDRIVDFRLLEEIRREVLK